jgi:hypothetical protein
MSTHHPCYDVMLLLMLSPRETHNACVTLVQTFFGAAAPCAADEK